MCLCVPSQNTVFRRLWRLLVKSHPPNVPMRWHFVYEFYVKKEGVWVFANHPTVHSGIISKGGGAVSTAVLPPVLASITSLTTSLTNRQTIFFSQNIHIFLFWSTFFVGQNYFWQANFWQKIVFGQTNFCLKTFLAEIKFGNKKFLNKKNNSLNKKFAQKKFHQKNSFGEKKDVPKKLIGPNKF